MSTATDTTVTVRFDPTAINKQSDIIGPATTTKAGAMTAAQVVALQNVPSVFAGSVVTNDGVTHVLVDVPATRDGMYMGSFPAAASDADGTDVAGFITFIAFRRTNGVVTLFTVGPVGPAASFGPTSPTWEIGFTAGTDSVQVTAKGAAGVTVSWKASVFLAFSS